MTENQPQEPTGARLAAEQPENATGEGQPPNGPHTGTQGFEGGEVYHWDAEQCAEAARLLAAHPPRNVELICTTVDMEAPMPEPTPAELTAEEARSLVDEMSLDLYRAQDAIEFVREMCALREKSQRASAGQGEVQTGEVLAWLKGPQCGRQMLAAHSTDTPVPVPADVREQIAAALYGHLVRSHESDSPWEGVKAGYLDSADAVLRVPAIAEALTAVAAVERVRAVHQPVEYRGRVICVDCSAYWGDSCDNGPQPHPCPTIAALDPQEQP